MELNDFPFAASLGDVELVRRLIEAGGDVNAMDVDGATSLHLAIGSKKSSNAISQIVDLLLQAGASLDKRNREGFTPLHTAAANGQIESVNQLIRAGADVNSEVDSNRVTSIFVAIKSDQPDNGCSEVIRLLAEAGASLDHQDAYGFSPLRKAVALGKVNAVRQLILNGANVNERNNAGKSILMVAARSRRDEEDALQIIQMLLDAGALPNIPDSEGLTPLHAAATLGNVRRVNQLTRAGADVNIIDHTKHRTILHSVISSKQPDESRFEVVRLLLEARAMLTNCNSDFDDALHAAVVERRVNTVDQLILAGANVNSLHPGSRRTPLHNAVEMGSVRIVERLIEAGADFQAKDSKDQTALLIVVSPTRYCIEYNNRLQILRKLLRAGAPVNESDAGGKFPLGYAIELGCFEILEELILAGADVHNVGNNGNTFLHAVILKSEKFCSRQIARFVRILLDAGAPINACNDKNLTPLHIAVAEGHVEWVKNLTAAGANADAEDNLEQTSLHLAIRLDNVDKRTKIIRALLEAGASVVKNRFRYMTPLHFAVDGGKLTTAELKLLVQAYVKERPNIEITNGLELVSTSGDGRNDLLQVVTLLLMADVLQDIMFTPLHYAVMNDDVALMEQIIRDGADLDATNHKRMTSLNLVLHSVLHFSYRIKNYRQIVQLLLNANASVNVVDADGNSPLVYALKSNDVEIVQQLITAGADPQIITPDGESCLHWATWKNHDNYSPSSVATLIEVGAPVDVKSEREGHTPLHNAVRCGHVRAVEQLIAAGADVNAVSSSSRMTCLLWVFHSIPFIDSWARSAQQHSYFLGLFYEIVEMLLEAGANPNIRSGNGETPGETPLACAVALEDPKFVEQLINAGADVNAIDRTGYTSLVTICKKAIPPAARDSNCTIIRLLIAAGAELVYPGDGNSPKHLVLSGRPGSCYNFYTNCQKEIQKMRESVIDKSITFYHIFKGIKVSNFVRNEYVIRSFQRRDCVGLFPIFGKDLEKSFLEMQAKRNLMDEASNGLRHINTLWSDSICDQILNYLDDSDLSNLRYV